MSRLKAPCKRDCKDRCVGCRATCVAYMIYEAGKQIEVKEALKEAEHRSDIVRYYVDKRTRWMKQMSASRKWSMLNKRRK